MAGGNAIVPKFGDDTAGRYYREPASGLVFTTPGGHFFVKSGIII
jgi:hypothetical protein